MKNNKPSFTEKYAALLKLASIGFLILILLIPAGMIQSLIREREQRQNEAIDEVSLKWGNEQTIAGPFLTLPYYSYYKDNDENVIQTTSYAHFLPDNLDYLVGLHPEKLKRGIFEVVVYESNLEIKGSMPYPDFESLGIKEKDIIWDKAQICIGIPDMRGIKEKIIMRWENEEFEFQPGVISKDVIYSGVHTLVPLENRKSIFDFKLSIKLNGSKNVSFIPMGKENTVFVKSDWPDPSFDGSFLPVKRSIEKDGFEANWKVLHLNRNYPQKWINNTYKIDESKFGVNLLFPVDTYQKSMRSAKYAAMFIALTFLIFFFVEILNQKRIHPIQYTLVGLALTIFYVLLLSLSEHIGFLYAYVVASISIIGLITFYSHSFFKSKRLTTIMFLLLIILYYYIFTLLQLQDYALLMGSIGLFVVLAIVMYLSRKINWDTIGLKSKENEQKYE